MVSGFSTSGWSQILLRGRFLPLGEVLVASSHILKPCFTLSTVNVVSIGGGSSSCGRRDVINNFIIGSVQNVSSSLSPLRNWVACVVSVANLKRLMTSFCARGVSFDCEKCVLWWLSKVFTSCYLFVTRTVPTGYFVSAKWRLLNVVGFR